MPRPREREFTITHCFSMEKWLKDQLELEASEEGISMSRLVERILLDYFERKTKERKKNVAVADPPADPPSNARSMQEEIDPLVELELEELNQCIEQYEKEMASFESYKKATIRIPKWLTKAEIQSAYQKHEAEIQKRKRKLTEEWNGLKERYEKLRKKLPKAKATEISRKLASMKKKLNAL